MIKVQQSILDNPAEDYFTSMFTTLGQDIYRVSEEEKFEQISTNVKNHNFNFIKRAQLSIGRNMPSMGSDEAQDFFDHDENVSTGR